MVTSAHKTRLLAPRVPARDVQWNIVPLLRNPCLDPRVARLELALQLSRIGAVHVIPLYLRRALLRPRAVVHFNRRVHERRTASVHVRDPDISVGSETGREKSVVTTHTILA